MRKLIFNYFLILAAIYFVLSFLDRNGEYAVEQRLWQANKKLSKVIRDTNVVPDQTYEEIAKDYEKIVRDFPQSHLRPRAHMLLAQVYSTKKDYATARKKLNEIFTNYPDNTKIQSEAYLEIAKTYEKENDWKKAEETYNRLIEQFTLTEIGLNAPLYLANHYREQKDYAKADQAYQSAVTHFQQIAAQNPNSIIEYKALKNLGNAYLLQKKWREGIDVFGDILLKYPNPHIGSQVIQTINAVSVIELKDFTPPIEIYQKILKENPKHPFSKTLEKMIAGFTELKNKNAKITVKDKK